MFLSLLLSSLFTLVITLEAIIYSCPCFCVNSLLQYAPFILAFILKSTLHASIYYYFTLLNILSLLFPPLVHSPFMETRKKIRAKIRGKSYWRVKTRVKSGVESGRKRKNNNMGLSNSVPVIKATFAVLI